MGFPLADKIDALMELLREHEADPRRLRAQRLIELHNDLLTGYEMVAGHSEHAGALDRRLDHWLRASDTGASLLRLALLQLHASFFMFRAGGVLGHDNGYRYACELRPANAQVEGVFFCDIVAPRIVDPVNTELPAEVRLEVLLTIARLLTESGVPPFFDDATPESSTDPRVVTMAGIPRHLLLLQFVRRWAEAGRRNLAESPDTLENRWLRTHRFEALARNDAIVRELLVRIGYLRPLTLWQRIQRSVGRLIGWFRTVLLDLPGVLRVTRRAAYVMLAILLLAAGTAAVGWVVVSSRDDLIRVQQRLPDRRAGSDSLGGER